MSMPYKTYCRPSFLSIANQKPLPIDFCQGDGFFDAYP
jgi:hypothetical protein